MFPAESVPEQIGAYQVQKYVGRNGAADVYVARMDGPLGFSRDVTLKLVRFAIEDDARTAEDLSREASICARLNHPVVVRMFDFFEHDRRLVLVLEQVEGASLDRLILHLVRRKQKLGDHAIFYLAAQVASALAHAHGSTDEDGNASPVIHRDIKPENVLISWDGSIRLAGFGLGKILGRTPDSVAGTIRGTPGFMAPEQTRGERATVRSDVYGFGILLWSLLTGLEPPQDGGRPTPIGEARPDLPRELIAAIEAALEPSPDKRRITCADLAQWLSKLSKADAGREELRQKVLWLRATRGPASKLDPSAKPARPPKRRQAIQATRATARRTGAPPSSRFPVPPSSRAPSSAQPDSSRAPASGAAPSGTPASHGPPPSERTLANMPRPPGAGAGGFSAREDTVILKLPPPPPLPGDGPSTKRTSGPPGANGPATMRPAVSVRTVSAPPSPRSVPPPPRPYVPTEDVLALAPQFPVPPGARRADAMPVRPGAAYAEPDSWASQGYPAPTFGEPPYSVVQQGRHTDTPASFEQPHTTQRPRNHEPPTFALTTQLLLAGLTASLVVALGLLFTQRQSPQQLQQPQVVTVEVNRQTETPREPPREPTRVEPPKPEKVEPPPAATAATPAMPDPATLADTMGYLMVKGPTATDVYLNGVRRGPTNEPIMVPCGSFFLRLAPINQGKFPAWSSRGEHAYIACKSSTVLTTRSLDPGANDGTAGR